MIRKTIQFEREQSGMDLEWLWVIIPASYILLSVFFLCFPNILHKRRVFKYAPFNRLVESDKMFCIGHRGGGWQGPQNTIELFSRNEKRLHMFELDVCLTKDNQLVVHHDANLIRTCGRDILISECNYCDLPHFQKEFQSFSGPMLISSQNKIPLLDDVFKKFPQKPMNIELKTPCEKAIAEFSRLVKKHGRQHITIWGVAGSLNEQLRKSAPDVLNFYSAGETIKIYLLFLTGLLPFVCIRQGILDIPLYSQAFYNLAMGFSSSNCQKCLIFLVLGALRCFNFFSRFFIPHLKKRGILTFYFILNTDEDFENAVSTGCSGIMTDVSQGLQIFLRRKGIYCEQKNPSFVSSPND